MGETATKVGSKVAKGVGKALPGVGLAFAAFEIAEISKAYDNATPEQRIDLNRQWQNHIKTYQDGKITINGKDYEFGGLARIGEFLALGVMEGPSTLANTINFSSVVDALDEQQTDMYVESANRSANYVGSISKGYMDYQPGTQFLPGLFDELADEDSASATDIDFTTKGGDVARQGLAEQLRSFFSDETYLTLDRVMFLNSQLQKGSSSARMTGDDIVEMFTRGYGKMNKTWSVEDDTEESSYNKLKLFKNNWYTNKSLGLDDLSGEIGTIGYIVDKSGNFNPSQLMSNILTASEDQDNLHDIYNNPGLAKQFDILHGDFKFGDPEPPVAPRGMARGTTAQQDKNKAKRDAYNKKLAAWKKATDGGIMNDKRKSLRARFAAFDEMYKTLPAIKSELLDKLPKLRDMYTKDLENYYSRLREAGFVPDAGSLTTGTSNEDAKYLQRKSDWTKKYQQLLDQQQQDMSDASQSALDNHMKLGRSIEMSNPANNRMTQITAGGALLQQGGLQGATMNAATGRVTNAGYAQGSAQLESGETMAYAVGLQQDATVYQLSQVEKVIEQNLAHANDLQHASETLQQINEALPDEVQINTNTFNIYKVDTPQVQGLETE